MGGRGDSSGSEEYPRAFQLAFEILKRFTFWCLVRITASSKFVCEDKIVLTHPVSLNEGFVFLEITLKVSAAILQYLMQSWAVFFTEGIDVAFVLLLLSQGVDQDGIAEGHGHHHHRSEQNKERHGHFDEAGEVGEAGEASECKLLLRKSLLAKTEWKNTN